MIDLAHLARQTLGDQALEVELLTCSSASRRASSRSSGTRGAAASSRADLAHTLKGSAPYRAGRVAAPRSSRDRRVGCEAASGRRGARRPRGRRAPSRSSGARSIACGASNKADPPSRRSTPLSLTRRRCGPTADAFRRRCRRRQKARDIRPFAPPPRLSMRRAGRMPHCARAADDRKNVLHDPYHLYRFAGKPETVEAQEGSTVMETALRNSDSRHRGRMRRRLRLRDLPCLCRPTMDRDSRQALADGRGHARLRLRGAPDFAPVLPDQGDAGARRPVVTTPGQAGLKPS